MKNKILHKLLSVLLAAVVLLGTGFTTAGQFVGTSVSVSASETLSYGDLNYYITDENTITISGYTGSGDLVIPDIIDGKRVTEIGGQAFYGSKTITGVTIPDSVTRIENYAFKNCTNLKNITVPEDSSIYCGDEIFEGTEWLTNQPDGDVYIGQIYCKYKGEMPQDYRFSIRKGTKSIIGGAAIRQTNLTSVIIPDGVEYIGTDAFWGCTNLTTISMPNSMKELGEASFCNCRKLSSVKFPEGMIVIGPRAFVNCTALSSISIPDSVTKIGRTAFSGCSGLKSITIGKGVTTILQSTFEDCLSLKNVAIPDGIVSIDSYAFSNCTSLTNVDIPDTVVSLGDGTFRNCISMQSITLPQSIKEIGSFTFAYYSSPRYSIPVNLTTVYGIGNTYAETYTNKYIGETNYGWQFTDISFSYNGFKYIIKDSGISVVGYDWDNTSIVIPSEIDGIPVTEIANYAFENTNITKIVLPDSIQNIGICAFKDCSELTSITLPKSMKTLNTKNRGSQFSGCCELVSVKLPENLEKIPDSAFEDCFGLKSIQFPGSVREIGNDSFKGCIGLESVFISPKVQSIGTSAFDNCSELTIYGEKGSYAEAYSKNHNIPFEYNVNIKSIAIKESPSKTIYARYEELAVDGSILVVYEDSTTETVNITQDMLSGYDMNKTGEQTVTVSYNGFKTSFKIIVTEEPVSDFKCFVNDDGTVTITGYNGNDTEVAIPATIAGKKVVEIGDSAFFGRSRIISVIIPKSVKIIGHAAFENCTKLKSVTMYDGLLEIGSVAFGYCENLQNIVLPGTLKKIGMLAFTDCHKLTDIVIPESVTTIGVGAFGGAGLENVTLTNSIGHIDDVVFSGTNIESITLPDGITGIGSNSFGYCSYLTKIVIPKSVKSIDDTAFQGCDNLKIYGENGSYAETYAKAKGIGFVAVSSLTNKSTISAESIKLGDSVKVMCAASGGTGSYQYNVLYKQTSQSKWTTAQSYKTNATVSFKPGSATTYDVCVKVKDGNGTEVKKYFTVKVTKAVAELSNTSTLSASSVKLGDTVTVKCSATGGTGTYQYNVLYKQTSQSKWTTAQSYKANTTVSFKPGSATTYDVCVKVKDSSGKEVKKFLTVKVEKATNELSNISTISSTSIKLGETVTVNAKGSGSSGFYLYAVYSKKTSDTKWTTQQNFSSNGKIIFKPEQAVSYDICVKVKDDKGSIAKKYFTVTVSSQSSLTNTSKISADTIKLGNSVTVECSAKGSTGFYQYAVYYKQTSQSKWTTKQNYDPNYTVSVKPNAATTYDICVKVKDNLGNEAKKYFTVTVK